MKVFTYYMLQKHNVPIAGETILCLAIILQFAIRQSHKGEQSENNRYTPRDYKGDREGIPHIHPIP